jgi:DeoR/GlpR family transcriptional regulator of sugar metabolism
MLKRERQAYILHQVNLHNKVLSTSLCEEINVSEDTIRRDLQELADEGRIIKVHGGALSQSFNYIGHPSAKVYSHSHKKSIAQKVVTLIKDGMFILTTGGTTIIELARILPPRLKATFISGSIPAVLEYLHHPTIEVILIGDKISRSSKITVGSDAIGKIKEIRADLCLMGINSIDINHGITENDWDVAQVKKAMVESSQKTVCMTISEKINTTQPVHICDLNKIDILITELPPDDPLLKPYSEKGLTLL